MKNTWVVLGTSFVLAWLFDYFFFEHWLGINFPIYCAAILIALFSLATFHKRPIPRHSWFFALGLMVFGSLVFVRYSVFLTFLNLIASLYFVILLVGSLTSFSLNALPLPFRFLRGSYEGMVEIFSARKSISGHQYLPGIARGVIISIPFILLFLILFSSADLIFREGLHSLVDVDINAEFILRLFIVLAVTFVFLGSFWYAFRKEYIPRDKTVSSFRFGHVEHSILLGTLNVLFLAFILVQLRYLFGTGEHILARGLTYAEYAHKGFFELIVASAISFGLLLLIGTIGERTRLFYFLSTALSAQVFVIMASAFKRLSLYESVYGFTNLRLFSQFFIVFLAIMFVLLLIHILMQTQTKHFVLQVFLAASLFLIAVNIMNPDAMIAEKNIKQFTGTDMLDVEYLAGLSDDALEELKTVPGIPEARFQQKRPAEWQSYHF